MFSTGSINHTVLVIPTVPLVSLNSVQLPQQYFVLNSKNVLPLLIWLPTKQGYITNENKVKEEQKTNLLYWTTGANAI